MPDKLEVPDDADKPKVAPFVLPIEPSPLIARLESFLPRIRAANEQLAQSTDASSADNESGQGTGVEEEPVVLEALSSSSDDSSSDDDDDDSSDDSDDSEDEEQREGMDVQEDGAEQPGPLSGLMDISTRRPIVTPRRLVNKQQPAIVELPDKDMDDETT